MRRVGTAGPARVQGGNAIFRSTTSRRAATTGAARSSGS